MILAFIPHFTEHMILDEEWEEWEEERQQSSGHSQD